MDEDDDCAIEDVAAGAVVVETEEEVIEVIAEDGNEEELALAAELEVFVITFRDVLMPANEVGVTRFIGGVLAFGGGGSCWVSTFS